jgi:EAL domain-containing protein (putative c-di-GMP-specific phosphodiesterase class I)
VDRLQDLDPLHVKIDRSVLQHEDVAAELAYIIDLVGPGQLSPSHIVVEGVDEDCPLSLPELFAIGVKFVQGFSLARPSPEIYPLDRDLAEFLAARVSEEAPIRAPRLLKHYA